ncbi:putative permease [Mucilaginibacter gracilis]|uniref:Putative permease n=1 Tax=Mucilaginibacter gracilis TaxID=423350 RepID=A0A495J9Y3_9SPHI|nr:ABC transporter permease [Mucilaginibacter gracilis]RKR85727.1 putative permease [Mucilaginibacter gracilis]
MLKNYIKTAWRSLARHKIFALINISGLAIGISAALVIYLIVYYDFSFDHFEKDNDRIYRVVTNFNMSGVTYHNRGVIAPMAGAVSKEATGVSEVSAFHQYNEVKVNITADNNIRPLMLKKQRNVIFADAAYFKLVTAYQWLAGSPDVALHEPNKVVITSKSAQLYFPGVKYHDVIGKQIIYNDSVRTTVTGVVNELPQHSDFIFQDFISLATIPTSGLKTNFSYDNWTMTNGSSQLYIKLVPGTTVPQVEKQLASLYKKYSPPPRANGSKYSIVHTLQPLSDVHFNADYGAYDEHTAHKPTLYYLLLVAAFLLALACINFINLSTAQASQRAKEIGIRKTMGSSRAQLIVQFLGETLLLTLIAAAASLLLIPVLLKAFSGFIPAGVSFNLLHQPHLVVFLLLLIVSVSLLSGFYPSWILSNYNPALVLKNQAYANTGKTRKTWIRKTLTVFQFLVAQLFIMGTIIVSKQIHYTLNKDMGFKKDAILSVYTQFYSKQPNLRYVLMDKLKTIPEIEMLSLAGSTPATDGTSSGQVNYKDGKKDIQTDVHFKFGDVNYLKLYHIPLLAGSNVHPSDTVKEAIINETYAHILGFKNVNDAVGKTLLWSGTQKLPIVGVMGDFNQQSLHQAIKPLLFSAAASNSYTIHIALKPQNADGTAWKNALSKIQMEFKAVYPETDFEYDFYDESIARFYQSDMHVSSLLQWATGLSVFISCLGLLGLVIYTTNLRTKEIGIRKVLGASVAHIVSILSADFVKLVVVAFIIASPIAWWATSKWLQNFAYHTNINWWIFLMSGMLMVVIALLTLSFQTVKAAIANPVNSLRSE